MPIERGQVVESYFSHKSIWVTLVLAVDPYTLHTTANIMQSVLDFGHLILLHRPNNMP